MFQKIYFMPKSTGTFADTLAAYGLATVLSEIVEKSTKRWSGQKVKIRDAGPYYEIELPTQLREAWVDKCKFFTLPNVKPIRTRNQSVKGIEDVWDLDKEWEKVKQAAAVRKSLGKTAENASQSVGETEGALSEWQTNPEFDVLALLGNTPMQALKTYNRIMLQWHGSREFFKDNLVALLRMSDTPDVDVKAVAQDWAKAIRQNKKGKNLTLEETASQLFNPIQGQGQNHPKANRLDTRKNLDSFWLLEYLKAAGLWISAVPREEYVDKTKKKKGLPSRKTYVIIPAEKGITLGAHSQVMRKFSAGLRSTTLVKMDCIAGLLYTRTLLEYSESGQEDELDFEGYGPENVVAGFQVAHYKGLNTKAYTMLGLGFISLPRWTGDLRTRAQVIELKEVIEEHLNVIGNIEEGRSDGYDLLVHYRDFLSGQQIDAFFDFTIGYSQYLTHELEQPQRARQFTTKNLRRLFMGAEPQLTEIIGKEGFRNIAYAIRRATVIAQYRKNKKERYQVRYDIRYGLGQQLSRKASYKGEFMAELSKFVHEYNAETAQMLENLEAQHQGGIPEGIQKQTRRRVETRDLDEIARLIDDTNDPRLICNMLIAYGYARESREEDDKESKS